MFHDDIIQLQNFFAGITKTDNLRNIVRTTQKKQYYLKTMELNVIVAAQHDLVKLLPSEMFIGGFCNQVYKSCTEEIMKEIKQHRSLITLDDSGKALAFSYICTLPAKLGTRSEMYYHGDVNPDIPKAHILKHCEAVLEVVNTEQYGLRMHFGQIPRDVIMEFMKELGFVTTSATGIQDIIEVYDLGGNL